MYFKLILQTSILVGPQAHSSSFTLSSTIANGHDLMSAGDAGTH